MFDETDFKQAQQELITTLKPFPMFEKTIVKLEGVQFNADKPKISYGALFDILKATSSLLSTETINANMLFSPCRDKGYEANEALHETVKKAYTLYIQVLNQSLPAEHKLQL